MSVRSQNAHSINFSHHSISLHSLSFLAEPFVLIALNTPIEEIKE